MFDRILLMAVVEAVRTAEAATKGRGEILIETSITSSYLLFNVLIFCTQLMAWQTGTISQAGISRAHNGNEIEGRQQGKHPQQTKQR